MTTVAIFGGTGYAGGAIRDEALSRGHTVICVSRSGAPADAPPKAGVEFRQGSVHDPALADQVAAEADVIVIAARFAPGGSGEGDTKLADALPALLAATARHGKRLGVVGGASTLLVTEGGPRLLDTPDFPAAYKTEASAAADALEDLRADTSGADWFFVSPAAEFGAYAPGEALGEYRIGGDVLLTDESGNSRISGADYALAFVDEIDNPKHHRTRFTVAY
ncbi:MAG TPA: NAD(P)H-binding protein [Trebonia sp.]|jgi:hypothetical protein|nr:NAD(P)H-binding protein [Trebonia sp.]